MRFQVCFHLHVKQYSTFIFDSYSFDPKEGRIELRYSLDASAKPSTGDGIQFIETLTLPRPYALHPTPALEAGLFALHLTGGISYYKTCCPEKIEIRSGALTEDQAKFWNTVYENGLGEFFYKNQIDFRGLMNFPTLRPTSHTPEGSSIRASGVGNARKVLVPIGGGKDSIVTAEILKHAGSDVTLFRMGTHPLIEECTKVAGLPLITVKRQLSPALFALNEQGALNGHVPITMYLSFLTIIVALLEGFDAVVMSNERSASEGNVSYLGKEINHQWSKSLEAERLFQEYVAQRINPDLRYFSLLRPLSELHIAKLFSGHPQYFRCATSCNKNWKILSEGKAQKGIWCGECPKCTFAFSLFAAFLPKETLLGIFGKNLYDETALLPLFKQLLGLEGCKPFECVGTPEETKAAFLLAHERGELEGTPAMKLFVESVLPSIKDPQSVIREALTPGKEHAIPEQFQHILHENL